MANVPATNPLGISASQSALSMISPRFANGTGSQFDRVDAAMRNRHVQQQQARDEFMRIKADMELTKQNQDKLKQKVQEHELAHREKLNQLKTEIHHQNDVKDQHFNSMQRTVVELKGRSETMEVDKEDLKREVSTLKSILGDSSDKLEQSQEQIKMYLTSELKKVESNARVGRKTLEENMHRQKIRMDTIEKVLMEKVSIARHEQGLKDVHSRIAAVAQAEKPMPMLTNGAQSDEQLEPLSRMIKDVTEKSLELERRLNEEQKKRWDMQEGLARHDHLFETYCETMQKGREDKGEPDAQKMKQLLEDRVKHFDDKVQQLDGLQQDVAERLAMLQESVEIIKANNVMANEDQFIRQAHGHVAGTLSLEDGSHPPMVSASPASSGLSSSPASPAVLSNANVAEMQNLADRIDELSDCVHSLKRGVPQLAEDSPVSQSVDDLHRRVLELEGSNEKTHQVLQERLMEVQDVASAATRTASDDGMDVSSREKAIHEALQHRVEHVEAKLNDDIAKLQHDFKAALEFAPSHDDVQEWKAIHSKVEADRLDEELAHKRLIARLAGVCGLLAQVGDAVASEHGFEEDTEA